MTEIMGGRGQRRYWLLNRIDWVRGWLRSRLTPWTVCGNERPLTPNGTFVLVCNKKRRHRGNHMDRRNLLAPRAAPTRGE